MAMQSLIRDIDQHFSTAASNAVCVPDELDTRKISRPEKLIGMNIYLPIEDVKILDLQSWHSLT